MNTIGRYFRCTTFGESHGPASGVVVDGCPPGITFSEEDVQLLLDRRRPGLSPFSSARSEPDRAEILSGVFEGRTTGAPVAMLVRSVDAQSSDYEELRDIARPGHADLVWQKKYGVRDHRGGGRSSGRETVGRVMAGALGMALLSRRGISVEGRIVEIHGESDPEKMSGEILSAKEAGDSVGGIVEVLAKGCPAGLGDPVFGKLDAALAGAIVSVGAVKAVGFGEGFGAASLYGSGNNDQMDASGYLSNHAGGILGGISTGQDIVIQAAVKPTPSIARSQKTVGISDGGERLISVKGRHDSCIVPRVVVVAEAMCALVLADALLAQDVISLWKRAD